MFLLDSLLISGLRWTLDTIRTAADHEALDEGALRDRLLEAEMRRELGEIDDDAFRAVEADVLMRLRDLREQRGGSAAFDVAGTAADRSDAGGFTVEATIEGDFHAATASEDAVTAAPVPAVAAPRRARRAPSPAPAVPAPRRARPVEAAQTSRLGGRRR